MSRRALIIGAGPAGLTAAWELLQRTDYRPLVLEASTDIGGISRTLKHQGNRIDIGGHRFFSQSDRVMDWWLSMLPLQGLADEPARLAYQGMARELRGAEGPDPDETEQVMLLRPRRSRIFHGGEFYDYPLRASPRTLATLGPRRGLEIGLSYARARLRPRPETSLEDLLINRFGRSLYLSFFKDYTEKVWGVPCEQISAEWGRQRIKGLDLGEAARHFFERLLPGSPRAVDKSQVPTSLIEHFLYPRHGPGQMWETVADRVQQGGGELRLGWTVLGVEAEGGRARAVVARDPQGAQHRLEGELVISTMPVQDLVRALEESWPAPPTLREISEGLVYRDFITVGLLSRRRQELRDNWIYIQQPGLSVGRVQLFHNWSPWMVADPGHAFLGMEYFCSIGDALWSRSDAELEQLAIAEAGQTGLLDPVDLVSACVIRMPRCYPAYFGSYSRFGELRAWLDRIEGLLLLGRNGMHRYNNQDHSMLTAMVAVDQLAAGRLDREALWAINTEPEYHEQRPLRRDRPRRTPGGG
jgi:protoporphyrinogen oxidase